MLLMQQHQSGLERRLRVIGIPIYTIKPFIGLICKWERCSGVEWTIKRLKSLKVDLIRRKEGLPPITWVRKNRHGDVYGILGSLFRWSDLSDKKFAICIQAFMAYTFYILPSLSESQKEKFLSGINPVEVSDGLDCAFFKAFTKTITRSTRRRVIDVVHRPLVTYQGSPDKRAPSMFGRRSVAQDQMILNDLQIFNTDGGMQLYRKYRELYAPLLVGIERRNYLDLIRDNSILNGNRFGFPKDIPVYGGEIHFLQEPGGKLRSVASPLRIHQEALRPLGEVLYDIVQSLPWDCTFDQTKAIPHIQSALSHGKVVHSIDLSSATDHFPLSLQETALRAIIHPDNHSFIDLFVEISRGKWKSPIGELSWTKGQPLGLYPSFGSFTLTHGFLLYHLNHGFNHDFFVVGDDVVILNDELRNRYINLLDRMRCPWSEDKSISSSKLSEFAGKIVISSRVIPQLKWRKLSDDNFLDICRLLGQRSRALLSSRQKSVFDKVVHLAEPFGLNVSLPNDNLLKMIIRTLDFYQPEKVVLGSLMGLRKKFNRLVYTSSEKIIPSELEDLSATFDEKVKSVMIQTIFAHLAISGTMDLDQFESLPSALGLLPRLPYSQYSPSRLNTLMRYERTLSHVRQ